MAAVAAVATLTVVALYPAVNLDPGAGLTLRGNASALTWAAGIAPTAVGDDQWAWTFDLTADDVANGWVPMRRGGRHARAFGQASPHLQRRFLSGDSNSLPELSSLPRSCDCSIAYKVLVDDDLWQVGANAQVVFPAGSSGTSAFTTTVYPWFGTQAGEHTDGAGRVTTRATAAPPVGAASPLPFCRASTRFQCAGGRCVSLPLWHSSCGCPAFLAAWLPCCVASGRYEYVRNVYSPQLQNVRDLVVYLPPSYDENHYKASGGRATGRAMLAVLASWPPAEVLSKAPHPCHARYCLLGGVRWVQVFGPGSVLYMHDGQNLFNASTSAFGTAWMCQDTVNAMVVQGNMREVSRVVPVGGVGWGEPLVQVHACMPGLRPSSSSSSGPAPPGLQIIIVGIDNTANRTYELTYSVDPTVGTGGGLDRYLDFMEQTVMPLVQGRYRINADASASGASARWDILGSSLGGLASCYAAWTRPAIYGFAGACRRA